MLVTTGNNICLPLFVVRVLLVYDLPAGQHPQAGPELPHHQTNQDLREAQDDLQASGPRTEGGRSRIFTVCNN